MGDKECNKVVTEVPTKVECNKVAKCKVKTDPKVVNNNKDPKTNKLVANNKNQQQSSSITVSSLKNKLSEFLQLDQDKQRQILGELLYPLVRQHTNDVNAPKITGMLIDLSVLEVQEILDFLEDPASLKERVEEAEELIKTQEA